METIVLELMNLRKRYVCRMVLDGASLQVAGGEAVALVGANGSGKTTTLKCAVGLHHLDGGSVRISGVDPSRDGRAARMQLSYLPQRADFPMTLTVREILQVVSRVRKLSGGTVERELSLCGLSRLAGRTVSALSGGERQRVALAVLLLPDVPLYLLDEPTASLDAPGTQLLIDRVCALRDAGRAVLFTTHIGADLERLATRVAILRAGRIELTTHTDLSHLVVDLHGSAHGWVAAAMELKAQRVWAEDRRLHVVAPVASVGAVVGGLQARGLVIRSFRTEHALAAALDRVNQEADDAAAGPADVDDQRREPGWLWRPRYWAGTGATRSR
jgi:ABC-type multidrug transport system ATPase subunit